MKRVTVTELKNRLSEFLRLVKRGETIQILEHSIPIAQIEGLMGESSTAKGHLNRLTFDGIVIPPRAKPDPKLPPPLACKGDPVKALIEERGDR